MLGLLKKAYENSIYSKDLTILTYNNFACYYRFMGKFRTALDYLEKALALEKQSRNHKSMADIFLNICVILSSLKKHKDALDAALNAIFLIQEELIDHMLPNFFTGFYKSNMSKGYPGGRPGDMNIVKKPNQTTLTNFKNDSPTFDHLGLQSDFMIDRIKVLVIAYHNMGAELEHLNLYEDALRVYEKGFKLAINYLGEDEAITKDLETIIEMIGSRIRSKKRPSSLQQYKISTAAMKTEKYFGRETNKENLSINISQSDIPEVALQGFNTDRRQRPSHNKISSTSAIQQVEQAIEHYRENVSQAVSNTSKAKKSLSSIVRSMKLFYPKSTLKSKILKNEQSFVDGQNEQSVSKNVVSFKTNAVLPNDVGYGLGQLSETPVEKNNKAVFQQNHKDLEFRKSQTVPINAELMQLQKFHEKVLDTRPNNQQSHEDQKSKTQSEQESSVGDPETNLQPRSGSRHSFVAEQKSKKTINISYTSDHDYTGKTHTLISAPSSFSNLINRPKKIGSNPILNHGQQRHLKRPVLNHARYLQAKNQPVPIDEKPEESMMTNNITLAQSSCDSQIDPETHLDQDTGSFEGSKFENSDFQGDVSISKPPNVRERNRIGTVAMNNSSSLQSKDVIHSPKNSHFNLQVHSTAYIAQKFQKNRNPTELISNLSKDIHDE